MTPEECTRARSLLAGFAKHCLGPLNDLFEEIGDPSKVKGKRLRKQVSEVIYEWNGLLASYKDTVQELTRESYDLAMAELEVATDQEHLEIIKDRDRNNQKKF
jgi:hypothetical protein